MHSIHSIEEFYAAAQPFVNLFNEFARLHMLEGGAVADHICYKCSSNKSFEHVRRLFESAEHGSYIHQSIIPPQTGRRIAYIRLMKPIATRLGPIDYLELSDQKPDNTQKEGFDHIEAYPVHYWRPSDYEAMVEQIAATPGSRPTKVERPHHTTDDVDMGNGFKFRCSHEPLIRKIVREEVKLVIKD